MQVTISGHHLEITAALHAYVQSKLERLERHNGHITQVAVILSVEKLIQKAEATICARGQARPATDQAQGKTAWALSVG